MENNNKKMIAFLLLVAVVIFTVIIYMEVYDSKFTNSIPIIVVGYFIWVIFNYKEILKPQYFIFSQYVYIYLLGYYRLYVLRGTEALQILYFIIPNMFCFLLGVKVIEKLLYKDDIIYEKSKFRYIYNEQSMNKLSGLLMVIGILAIILFYKKAGGIPIFMGELESKRISMITGNGVPYHLSMMLMVSIWIKVLFYNKKDRISIIVYCFLVSFLLLSTGWRNTFLAMVMIMIIIMLTLEKISTRAFINIVAVSLFIIIAFGMYRIYSSNLSDYYVYDLIKNKSYFKAIFFYFTSYAATFYDGFYRVFSYYKLAGTRFMGLTFIWNFYLLFGKSATPFDMYLKDTIGFSFTGGGVPPTILGDFYINFGWIFTLFFTFLFGVLCSYVYLRIRQLKGEKDLFSIMIYCTLYYYLFVAIRGGVENITLIVTWICGTMILAKVIFRANGWYEKLEVK